VRIDVHQHFLAHERFDYGDWVRPGSPLEKDYLPDHVERILKRNRFDGLIAVQLTPTEDETRWLLELAARDAMILGVVARADFGRVGEFVDRTKLVGAWLQAEDATVDELYALARRNLACELAAGPETLDRVHRLAEAVPELQVVIPHMGRPPFGAEGFAEWAAAMEGIARHCPQVTVKLSGLLPPGMPEVEKAVQHLLGAFGPGRLMFASNWPFCLEATDAWKKVLATFTQALGAQTMEVRAKILGETAARVYRLA
jgi:L-fuconolactonase